MQNDPQNCGMCGHACASGEACCSAACVATASCSFAVTGVSPPNGWLNGGTWLDLTGAGFVKGMKVTIGGGRAPVRVVDASHATVLTPPGPAGLADVTIASGASTATLHGGFLYEAAGLTKQWIEVTMSTARGEEPALALLRDGRVLIAGGSQNEDISSSTQASAELFTRPTTSFAPAANMMSATRWWNSAVTMLTGKVLVVGGTCDYWADASCSLDPVGQTKADLFDPVTNAFTPTAMPMNKPRSETMATLLVDGRVLITSMNDPSVEIYDPDADSFQLVAHTQGHGFGFMVRLRDGRVLLGGGQSTAGPQAPLTTSVEAFDPDTSTFTMVGSLKQTRYIGVGVALPDGSMIVVGGDPAGNVIERFDPATSMFSVTPYALAVGRSEEAAVLVGDGTVLVVGGILPVGCNTTTSVEQIDPVAGTVSKFPDRPSSSTELSGLTLADGSVLVAGGVKCMPGTGGPNSNFVEFLAGVPPVK
jgi:hypothetical protein